MVNSELQQYNEDDLILADRYMPHRMIAYIRKRHFKNKRIPKHVSSCYGLMLYDIATIILVRPHIRKVGDKLNIYQCGIRHDKRYITESLKQEAEKLFPEYINNINIII